MFNYDYWLTLRGGSGGKTFGQCFDNGRVTMTGTHKGVAFKHTVFYENAKIKERKLIKDGKTVIHTVYGSYETTPKGIVRFRKGTKTGKHGKARTCEKLFGHEGVCHSWYSCGRLMKQKFIYDDGVTAYFWKGHKPFIVKDYNGKASAEIIGKLKGASGNSYDGCHSVLAGNMDSWFSESEPFEVRKDGKPFYSGKFENRQKVGRWFEGGKEYFYERGVAIPKKLYETPPDKLKVDELLKLDNAQLRMALMSKVSPEKIAKCGTVIHKEGDMRLFNIKKFDSRILRVRCPSTKQFYYLMVPKDSKKCEEARQWTFGVGETFNKPIKFEVET